jgi:hypothetical protein
MNAGLSARNDITPHEYKKTSNVHHGNSHVFEEMMGSMLSQVDKSWLLLQVAARRMLVPDQRNHARIQV